MDIEKKDEAQTPKGEILIPDEIAQNPQLLAAIQHSSVEMRSGPLPSPDDMERYEQILPGAADRCFTMAESQLEHRHIIEKQAVSGIERRADRAPLFGVAALSIICVTAYVFAFFNYAPAGIWLVFGSLAGVVGVIVTGSMSTKKQRDKRDKLLKTGSPPDDVPTDSDLVLPEPADEED